MNHSLYSADRATHMKIVVVALACATVVAGVGIAARVTHYNTSANMSARLQGTGPIIRAGGPVTITTRDDGPTVR
jgi:hypothetical protein